MTLSEFGLLPEARPLNDVLEMNFESDRAAGLDFFSAESESCPDFDRLCRQRVIAHLPEGRRRCGGLRLEQVEPARTHCPPDFQDVPPNGFGGAEDNPCMIEFAATTVTKHWRPPGYFLQSADVGVAGYVNVRVSSWVKESGTGLLIRRSLIRVQVGEPS